MAFVDHWALEERGHARSDQAAAAFFAVKQDWRLSIPGAIILKLADHMLNTKLPSVYLVRHGETAWSISGQHTGHSDIPLTDAGENDARRLRHRLCGMHYTKILTSPLQRALKTCVLAGFEAAAVPDVDLIEWDYGEYEGLTTAQIRIRQPGWNLFRDGCPGGESIEAVAARADRVIERIRREDDNTLVFSSGHFLRMFAVRWLGLEPVCGQYFGLKPASVSILGYDHGCDEPIMHLWNETRSA